MLYREIPQLRPIAYNAGMAATSMKEPAAEAVAGARPRDLYFEDAWSWSREQAAALRRRDLGAIDWDNVIEEIEDVGKRHYERWVSNCGNAIAHMLKIEHYRSPEDVNHWRREVLGYRRKMHRTLRRHRGMKGQLGEMLAEAWGDGRQDAVDAMAEYDAPDDPAAQGLRGRAWESRLPAERPYHFEDIAGYDPFKKDAEPDPEVWPAPVARVLNEALGTNYPVRERGPERSLVPETGYSR